MQRSQAGLLMEPMLPDVPNDVWQWLCVNGLMLTGLTYAFICVVLAKTQREAKEGSAQCRDTAGLWCLHWPLRGWPKYVEGSVKSSSFNCLFFFPFSIRSVMQKYLEERGELTFDKIFHQKIGESHCNGMQFSCIP